MELSDDEALIAHLELRFEMLNRELYGQRSERMALSWSSRTHHHSRRE